MSVVRSLVAMQGGQVLVGSKGGSKGSELSFSLTVEMADFGKKLGASDYPLKPLSARRLRESVSRLLESNGPTAAGEIF